MQSLWDRLAQELEVYSHRLSFARLKQELRQDTLNQSLLLELKDYVALKNAWGRSRIQVIRVNYFFYLQVFWESFKKR